MFSRMVMRRAPAQTACTLGSGGRRMAHSTPRVSRKPVSSVSTSVSAVKTGTSPQRAITPLACPAMCFRSSRSETGTYPASSARSMTLGLSAMNSPCSGSCRLRSCASVSRA